MNNHPFPPSNRRTSDVDQRTNRRPSPPPLKWCIFLNPARFAPRGMNLSAMTSPCSCPPCRCLNSKLKYMPVAIVQRCALVLLSLLHLLQILDGPFLAPVEFVRPSYVSDEVALQWTVSSPTAPGQMSRTRS